MLEFLIDVNVLAFLCAVLLLLVIIVITIIAQERKCHPTTAISHLYNYIKMNKSGKKEPAKKFLFKKKSQPQPPTEVVDVDSDSDSDFADFDLVTSDNSNATTDTDTGDFKDVRRLSPKSKQNKEEWSDIMSKMRKGRYTAEKHEEAKESWKGLFGIMQKNQQTSGVKAKGSKVNKRQLKQSLLNNNIKRVKSDLVIGNGGAPAPAKVVVTVNVEDEDDDAPDSNDLTCDNSISVNGIRSAMTMTVPVPAPSSSIPLCPIFLRPSASAASTSKIDDNNVENMPKPWDLVHSDNPWICDITKDLVPSVIRLNDSETNLAGTSVESTKSTKTKSCPFYKKLPGTKFAVDAFDCGVIPGIDVYLLSHFHADHYQGLTGKFAKTLICSAPTGNLVKMKLGVSDQCIRKLELNKPYIVQGVEVVLVDANHCPGSVMFILKLPNGTIYLHTGDFRYTTEMLGNIFLQKLRVDCLYLDTTYCDPQYNFPKQTDAISQAITAIKKHLAYRPKTLVVCGAYCIGKERVFYAIAEALDTKVLCLYDKRRVINALENSYFKELLGDKEDNCQVHVMPMFKLNVKVLSEYLTSKAGAYTNIFAVKPTGWEFSKGPGKSAVGSNVRSHCNDTITIMGVPYSEHSSFSELREFVTTIKPIRVQPTVNVGNVTKRTSMMAHIDSWLSGC